MTALGICLAIAIVTWLALALAVIVRECRETLKRDEARFRLDNLYRDAEPAKPLTLNMDY